jgi:hypothetical protein
MFRLDCELDRIIEDHEEDSLSDCASSDSDESHDE